MSIRPNQRWRRAAGLAGLLGAVGLLVTSKGLSGQSTRHLALPPGSHLASPSTTPPSVPDSTSSRTTTSSSNPPAGSTPVTTSIPATTVSTAAGPRLVTGDPEQNPYGTVQVRLSLTGTRITDVITLQSPADRGRSVEIAQQALPALRHEVLDAQSAQIDVVSGASYDSQGYAQSVQSALDRARS